MKKKRKRTVRGKADKPTMRMTVVPGTEELVDPSFREASRARTHIPIDSRSVEPENPVK